MKKEIAKKLKVKPGHTILILNSPEGYLSKSSTAERKIVPGKQYDFIQLFVISKLELDKFFPRVLKATKRETLLWITYPKKSSSVKTDLHRDYGWEVLAKNGYEANALVAIDETWSALRFREKAMSSVAEQSVPAAHRRKFTALVEKPDDGIDGAFVSIPFDVEKVYGTKGQVKVKAWFDGYPYRGVLANMGAGCHLIILRKDIREAIGKNPGDKITVELERDTEERSVEIPGDLKKGFSQSKKAEVFFNSLSYTNKKEYVVWITSAKKPETREKRLSDTIQKLLQEKKNPAQK